MSRKFFLMTIMALFLIAIPFLSGCATDSASKAYYNAALMAAQQQKPLLLLEAKEGEKIELSGVKSLAVYAPMPGLPQYIDPWAGVVRDGIVAVTGLGSVYLGLQGAVNLVDATGKIAGRNINYNYGTGSYQGNVGPGTYASPNSQVVNPNGALTGSPGVSNAPITDNHQQVAP